MVNINLSHMISHLCSLISLASEVCPNLIFFYYYSFNFYSILSNYCLYLPVMVNFKFNLTGPQGAQTFGQTLFWVLL